MGKWPDREWTRLMRCCEAAEGKRLGQTSSQVAQQFLGPVL
jgi:hypothetical protein